MEEGTKVVDEVSWMCGYEPGKEWKLCPGCVELESVEVILSW